MYIGFKDPHTSSSSHRSPPISPDLPASRLGPAPRATRRRSRAARRLRLHLLPRLQGRPHPVPKDHDPVARRRRRRRRRGGGRAAPVCGAGRVAGQPYRGALPPISPRISPYLPISPPDLPQISPVSPRISPHLHRRSSAPSSRQRSASGGSLWPRASWRRSRSSTRRSGANK